MGRKIDKFILHHSVSSWGDGDTVKKWHMDKKPLGNGWRAPGYHVVICNDFPNYNSYSTQKPVNGANGRIDRIWSESTIANGCKYANRNALHACMIGDFDKDNPTKEQLESVIRLLVYWCKKYKRSENDIYGHGEMQKKIGREGYSKTCPGKNVDMDEIRNAVKELLNG